VRARSMTSRSILVGQDQLKSAMGLNFLISERRTRRSRQAAVSTFGGFGLGQVNARRTECNNQPGRTY
jgi:hypothetical protein